MRVGLERPHNLHLVPSTREQRYKNMSKTRVRRATRQADLQRTHTRSRCAGLGAVDELNGYFDVLVLVG